MCNYFNFLGIAELEAYEIVLGDASNQVSQIRDSVSGSSAPVTANTPEILDCTEGRWFWMSWRAGLIQVGRGIEPGLDMIMFWQDPSGGHEVQSVGVSTGADTKGVFEFLENVEGGFQLIASSTILLSPMQSDLFILDGQFLIKTSGRNDHNTVWLTAPRSFISFSVEACAEAHISLAETPGVLGDAAYEVILGADSNTKSRILKDMNSQQIVDEEDRIR